MTVQPVDPMPPSPPVRPKRKVVVVEYDPDWPRHFEWLAAHFRPVLGDVAIAIEHVGSTSIPGLAAKPIVDIDVVVPTPEEIPTAIARFATLGYAHIGDLGIPGREVLNRPREGPFATVAHNLYVNAAGGEELHR